MIRTRRGRPWSGGLVSICLLILAGSPSWANFAVSQISHSSPSGASVPPTASLSHARQLLRLGKTDRAMTTLQGVLRRDPRSVPAHHLLGSIYLARKEYEPALREFSRETQLAPDGIGGYFGLAEIHYRQHQNAAAATALEKVLRIDPRNVQAHAKLGVISASQMDSWRAVAQFRRALELDPNADYVHYYLGDLLRKLSRNEEALTHLDRAVSLLSLIHI